MQKKYKIITIVFLILFGLFGFVVISEMGSGGGFSRLSPNNKYELSVFSIEKGMFLFKKNTVSIWISKIGNDSIKTKKDILFTYFHDAPGMYFRGNKNNKIEWSEDSESVSASFEDIIQAKPVIVSINYNLKTGCFSFLSKPHDKAE
jgi:hypothetical protein